MLKYLHIELHIVEAAVIPGLSLLTRVFFSLGMVKRKILVLDLDETLIHSHHDGVLRQTVKPGTPPDFVLKVNVFQFTYSEKCLVNTVSFVVPVSQY